MPPKIRGTEKTNWRVASWGTTSLLLLLCSVALIRDTRYQGQDFEVFWRAGRYLIQGQPLYSLARDGAMIFKYPPWIATLFIPFSFLSVETAKWIWGVIEVLSLLGAVRWVLAHSQKPLGVVAVVFSFWGIWAVHALDGQITLVILFLALWAEEKHRFTADAAAHLALSTKVFPWFAMPGLGKRAFRPKTLILVVTFVFLFSLPALVSTPGHSVFELLKSWKEAALSGAGAFGEAKIFGRENQGLPALTGRLFPETRAWNSAGLFLIWAAPLFSLWAFISRKWDSAPRFAGWLALAACTHPLAWFHSFVLCFPAAALSVDGSVRSRKIIPTALSVIGVIATGGVTAKLLGGIGESLEFYSVKSLGSLLCLAVLSWVSFSSKPGSSNSALQR